MKKITYEEAIKAVNDNLIVVCQWGSHSGQENILHTEEEVRSMQKSKENGMQNAIFYLQPDQKIKSSKEYIEISFDEAYKMLYSEEEIVYGQINGKEVEIEDIEDLKIFYGRYGQNLKLYWR